MPMTPLESAVRTRLKEAYRSIVGTRPEMHEATLDRMVEEKANLVLPVLRETLSEDATPSLDHIHLAELEATKRQMRHMIGQMTDPVGQAIQDRAQKELEATPVVTPSPDLLADELERQIAELEARINEDADGGPRRNGC